MKKRILIVGAGFAGMWAALSAIRLLEQYQQTDVEVTVLAPHPALERPVDTAAASTLSAELEASR